jgi:hypothetical protein
MTWFDGKNQSPASIVVLQTLRYLQGSNEMSTKFTTVPARETFAGDRSSKPARSAVSVHPPAAAAVHLPIDLGLGEHER